MSSRRAGRFCRRRIFLLFHFETSLVILPCLQREDRRLTINLSRVLAKPRFSNPAKMSLRGVRVWIKISRSDPLNGLVRPLGWPDCLFAPATGWPATGRVCLGRDSAAVLTLPLQQYSSRVSPLSMAALAFSRMRRASARFARSSVDPVPS